MKEKISRELESLVYNICYSNENLDMEGIIKEYQKTSHLSTMCPMVKLTISIYTIEGINKVSGNIIGILRRDMINLMSRVADSLDWIGYPNREIISRCINSARLDYKRDLEKEKLRKLGTTTNFISQPR